MLLSRLDDRLLLALNDLARDTGWPQAPMPAFAAYGLLLFGLLLLAGLVVARNGPDRRLAAAGWAGIATLVAVGLNQPIGHLFHEARPYARYPGLLVLATPTSDFSFPSDHAVMAGAVVGGLFLGAAVALVGWSAVSVPLTALTRMSRRQVGVRRIFDPNSGRGTGTQLADNRC